MSAAVEKKNSEQKDAGAMLVIEPAEEGSASTLDASVQRKLEEDDWKSMIDEQIQLERSLSQILSHNFRSSKLEKPQESASPHYCEALEAFQSALRTKDAATTKFGAVRHQRSVLSSMEHSAAGSETDPSAAGQQTNNGDDTIISDESSDGLKGGDPYIDENCNAMRFQGPLTKVGLVDDVLSELRMRGGQGASPTLSSNGVVEGGILRLFQKGFLTDEFPVRLLRAPFIHLPHLPTCFETHFAAQTHIFCTVSSRDLDLWLNHLHQIWFCLHHGISPQIFAETPQLLRLSKPELEDEASETFVEISKADSRQAAKQTGKGKERNDKKPSEANRRDEEADVEENEREQQEIAARLRKEKQMRQAAKGAVSAWVSFDYRTGKPIFSKSELGLRNQLRQLAIPIKNSSSPPSANAASDKYTSQSQSIPASSF